MARKPADPIETISAAAREFADVEEGTSCTQASFKTKGKAFLYAGLQGGRCKLMVKLEKSLPEAKELANERPDDFQVGANHWVTARFEKEKPIPARLWKKWIKESYSLCRKAF